MGGGAHKHVKSWNFISFAYSFDLLLNNLCESIVEVKKKKKSGIQKTKTWDSYREDKGYLKDHYALGLHSNQSRVELENKGLMKG